jgi:hypothetical protein
MSIFPYQKKSKLSWTEILPSDVFSKMFDFLTMWEVFGLFTVSKQFKLEALQYAQLKYHYEPWAYDPNDTLWPSLGMLNPMSIVDVGAIEQLAVDAYKVICSNLQDLFGDAGPGTGSEIVAEISKTHTNSSGVPLYGVNCLATLKLKDKQIWAMNFIYKESTMQKLVTTFQEMGYGSDSNYQLVTHRHAEMRLIMTVARSTGKAELNIDKVCCVFCASQLVALGYGQFVVGWNNGRLNWYTFSPVVMYFTERRKALWGANIDIEFMKLSRDGKIFFLKRLVECTLKQGSHVSSTHEVVNNNNKRLIEHELPAAKKEPICPKCGTRGRWAKSNYGSGYYVACPNFKNH